MDDFATLQSSIQNNLIATTRSVAQLAAEDLPFQRSLDPSIGSQLDAQNSRLLGLAQRLLGSATTSTEVVRPSLKDIDDIESNWTKVVDVIDSLLERADTALDEFTGAVKRLTPREGTPNPKSSPQVPRLAAAFRNQNIEKPQLQFEHKINNYATGSFRPLLLSKPHAIRQMHTQSTTANDHEQHPYQEEIERYSYPPTVYTLADPIPYHPFESTKAILVDTEEALEEMLQELKTAKEIAVDLEHHDQRSYIGIVCLMQISTRDNDWIVDTLKPWRRKLQCLNEVFADPSILKVLHGAHMDIIWLQRDLGLYIVGLFDTHFASRALGYPGGSYAFLLKKFTGVDAQKQFQMADWRIRPLPQELLDYARSDTHYLLYIYDNMRNDLVERSDFSAAICEKDKVNDVLQRSKETALQRYEHPVYDFDLGSGASGWYKSLSRTPAAFTREQFAVFRAVHQWRDSVAREQDDSVHYIMPMHMVFTIAKAVPSSKAELLSIAQPATQTLRLRADELLTAIAKAKADGASGPEMTEVLSKIEPPPSRRMAMPSSTERGPSIDGVAKYLPQNAVAPASAVNGTSTAGSSAALRCVTSAFWGSAFSLPPQQQQQYRGVATVQTVQLSVPLPPLTAEVFADADEEVPSAPRANGVVEAPTSPEPTQAADDDVFILKELGKKRKRAQEDTTDAMATQTDEVVIPDEEAERLRLKAERKKAKKDAKRAAKAGMAGQDTEPTDAAVDEQPFDYAAAPSMLNQPSAGLDRRKEDKKKKKQFNPYSKALDAPKGLPRAQKERAGRSMTYSS